MSFLPTKQQLEELWFKEWIWWDMIYESEKFNIVIELTESYSKFTIILLNHMKHRIWEQQYYPASRQDIATIIRLFTPNQ